MKKKQVIILLCKTLLYNRIQSCGFVNDFNKMYLYNNASVNEKAMKVFKSVTYTSKYNIKR